MENDPIVVTDKSEEVKTMLNHKPIIKLTRITPALKNNSGARLSRSGRRKKILSGFFCGSLKILFPAFFNHFLCMWSSIHTGTPILMSAPPSRPQQT